MKTIRTAFLTSVALSTVAMAILPAKANARDNPLASAKDARKSPNIIYILADQFRADTVGYAGDRKAITPNLDRFATRSMRFTNAVSVMPVCAAHRASLLTGKYPSSHGMVINELNMNPNHRTIAHVLGDAGYDLGYVGKWHLNDSHRRPTPKGPERMGFDGYWAAYSFNHQSYGSFYFTDGADGNLQRVALGRKHGPTAFTDLAIDYIGEASKKGKPFALFLSWNPPHDPWTKQNVPQANYEKFKHVRFGLPENFSATSDPYMDRYPRLAFEKQKWKEDFLSGGLEGCLRCYYAMINDLDQQFGRLMDQLDDLDIAQNTIVVFSSDHGEMFGSHGRMFKLTFYDEAARVPLLVRYPDRVKRGVSDVCINTPDIMPTLLGLAGHGAEIPESVEGQDLSHVLRGEKGPEPEAAFLQGMGHTYLWRDGFEWRAVRDKRFTYAKYLRDGKELLFDRQKDPLAKVNVVEDASYKQDADRLRGLMAKKMKSLGDEFHPCSWYRDNWMDEKYSVRASATGEFGPLPPIRASRK